MARHALKPTLALAIVLSTFIWLVEAFGGIFTGQGQDPNTGPVLILLASRYWPSRAQCDGRAEPVSLTPARAAADSRARACGNLGAIRTQGNHCPIFMTILDDFPVIDFGTYNSIMYLRCRKP